MILEFFRFELREQLRSPLLWLIAGLFGLIAFTVASTDAVTLGSAVGNVNRNAPLVTLQFLVIASVLGLFVICIFIAGALLRDFEAGTADLLFSNPIRKRDYLAGRFGAGLTASLIVYIAFALGLFIAPYMPWIDPARIGPNALMPYAWGMGVLVLPNLLLTGALLALLAVTTRSLLAVYVGVIAFFVLYVVSGVLLSDLDNRWLAALSDPFGVRALGLSTRYWSAQDRNTLLPELGGYLIANRALWIGVGLMLAAAAFRLFKTERSGTGRAWFKRRAALVSASVQRVVPLPVTKPESGLRVSLRQYLQILKFDARGVFTSVPFLIMLLFGMVNFLGSATDISSLYGTPSYPVTSLMLETLEGAYGWLLYIIVMFYAGELVWRERQLRLSDVTDALPVPDAAPLFAKFSALVLVVFAFLVAGVLASMGVQLSKGFTQLEPLLYLKAILVMAVPAILVAGAALVLQVLSNNKFIAYGLLMGGIALLVVLDYVGYENNLYRYYGSPDLPYSDLNGYGHFWIAWAWFKGYWALFLTALLLLATALWVRGTATTRRERLRLARQRMRGPLGAGLALATMAWVGVGSYIFYNTHVLNRYSSRETVIADQIRYEELYKKYEGQPQPLITAQAIEVDLDPYALKLEVRGEYTLRNPHFVPLQEIHVQLNPQAEHPSMDLGAAELRHDDVELGYRIYRLEQAMQPGETRTMRFTLRSQQRGFGNQRGPTEIVHNGTFFNNFSFPSLGYSRGRALGDRNERRKRGLPEAPRMADLDDTEAHAHTYVTDDGHWIDFSATFCTATDQIGLAPGYLKREFERDGRRCFEYAMDRPILPFYSFLSARWQVTRGDFNGLPIEIYHHPDHAWNAERMIKSVQDSLDYFGTHFSPYQHRQVRIIEFPGYQSFAQAFPNTIPYSEAIGFIADLRDPEDIDYVYYVTAHEIAHQWWAHQVIGADVQGSTVMSESLAQYSALMVMEREYGRERMRRFLRYELDRYLSGRGGESREEQPLYRVENQPYIHYQKGSLVFYRLREEIGEATLNRALSRYLADKAFQQPPFTTSRELLTYIREEAGPQHEALITDLFERIVFYDNRVEEVQIEALADGRYALTLQLHAAKFHADGVGKETPVPVDDWIEVGVFARAPGASEQEETVLSLKRHHITTAAPEIRIEVDALPYEVGFDPYNKLIDRVSRDNRKRVSAPAG
ncbi:M1 family aminopeptidase [Aquimonas sp.]|uniref:ABC transporter permease/M1 family aminopeptidase n=1 Tax=Aquimonas sp. TaxID=1872588 RepID=UPI0037C108DC